MKIQFKDGTVFDSKEHYTSILLYLGGMCLSGTIIWIIIGFLIYSSCSK